MTTHSVLTQENAKLHRRLAEPDEPDPATTLAALRESEARYRLLADNAADVIWILDAGAGRFTYVSPSVERLRGYTPAEVLDQPLHEVMTPASLALVNADLPGRAAAFLSGDPAATVKTHEIEQTRRDGSTVWTEVRTTLLQQPDGGIHVLGVSRDISERKVAEAALRASEERYRIVFDGATEGIIAAEASSLAITYVNRAMCTLFGYTEAEFLHFTILDLHPPDAWPQAKIEFDTATHQEKVLIANFPCQRKDGTRFYVDIKAANMPLDGKPVVVGFFQDVTERRHRDALLRARLSLSTLPPDGALDELLQAALHEVELVTESTVSFFHFLDASPGTVAPQSWTSSTRWQDCARASAGQHPILHEAGVWEECVRERVPKLYNDYAALPHPAPLPEGHEPLNRLLTAPVERDGRIVAVIGVGGKATDYNEQDVRAVALLATETWDIVLRKCAEAALRESEGRYRTLIESQESIIAVVDEEGVHQYMNSIGMQLLDRMPADVVGQKIFDLFPAETSEKQMDDIRQVISSGQGVTIEKPIVWDGAERWYRTNIQPLRNSDGQVTLALVNAVDITQRKTTERILEDRVHQRTSEIDSIRQRLELAARAAHIGIWEWNCQSGEMIWDDQMLRLYGIPRTRFDHTIDSWKRCIHPADLPHQWKLIESALHGESEFETEFRVLWPDGSEHYLKAYVITLFDGQAHPARMIGANYDISLTKQAEQMLRQREETLRLANLELERAVRMKDDFLASMSHELRTPLTGILGMSEALQIANYGELNERQRRAVENIESSGRHLLALINDILDISKIEADKLELQLGPTSVEEICAASLELVKGMAEKKRQEVRLTIDPICTYLLCDARRVKQILVNLFSNAVKFTPESGEIGLEVVGDAEAHIMRMTVWDSGIGIAAEQLPLLFQPFVQLDSSIARHQAGTGLGLALVSRLVALHGGSVTVESTPGVGSRFTVALPWRPTDNAQPATTAVVAGRIMVQRIMTVDDNLLDADRLTRFLRSNGVENIVHNAGKGAVERAAATQPELILLDVNLPDTTGWHILADLKADERTRAIPVVIASAGEDRVRAASLGAAGYLVKPVAPIDLRALLESLPAASPSPATVKAISLGQAGPVIMVVDDNQVNIDTLSDFLEINEYRVAAAHSGREFLERAPEVRPTLVLMDIQMPGMDGLEATQHLRRHYDAKLAKVPIIALTALAMPGDRERCLAAGANEYMSKPMSLTELLATIARLIAGA